VRAGISKPFSLTAPADEIERAAAALAGPLLASRGVLVLTVLKGDVAAARERLAVVPAAAGAEPRVLAGVPLAPGVPARDGDPAARAAAWDALLGGLGARPRARA